jgi:hypothetical protein
MIGGRVPDRGWKRPFDEPIPLPRGRELSCVGSPALAAQSVTVELVMGWPPPRTSPLRLSADPSRGRREGFARELTNSGRSS